VDGDLARSINVRHKNHAVSLQNFVGVGNNKVLLSSIINSFPRRAGAEKHVDALQSRFLLGPAGPVGLRPQRRRERIEP
jgi:hypothetical protein